MFNPKTKAHLKINLKKSTYSSTSPMNQDTLSSFPTSATKESTGSSLHLKAKEAQVLSIILKELLPSVQLPLTQRENSLWDILQAPGRGPQTF